LLASSIRYVPVTQLKRTGGRWRYARSKATVHATTSPSVDSYLLIKLLLLVQLDTCRFVLITLVIKTIFLDAPKKIMIVPNRVRPLDHKEVKK